MNSENILLLYLCLFSARELLVISEVSTFLISIEFYCVVIAMVYTRILPFCSSNARYTKSIY